MHAPSALFELQLPPFDVDLPRTRLLTLMRNDELARFVLGRDRGAGCGALARLGRLARLGLGGTIGSGTQGMSWIHEADLNRLFERAVANHSRRLLAIARAIVGTRASPEDVVQQAVTNLFQHRHRYDWREPGGLLKRAVVNEALRLLRHPRMAVVGEEQPERRSRTP